jgi:hypothetical protein
MFRATLQESEKKLILNWLHFISYAVKPFFWIKKPLKYTLEWEACFKSKN